MDTETKPFIPSNLIANKAAKAAKAKEENTLFGCEQVVDQYRAAEAAAKEAAAASALAKASIIDICKVEFESSIKLGRPVKSLFLHGSAGPGVVVSFRETYTKVNPEVAPALFKGPAAELLDQGTDIKLAEGVTLEALKRAAGPRWPEVEALLTITPWAKLKAGTTEARAKLQDPMLDEVARLTMSSPQVTVQK
jgi:hypothetical protein